MPNQTIPADRRLKSRFELDLGVRFRLLAGSSGCGAGRAVNVSSGGVLIVPQRGGSQDEIRVGAWVEISIEWPTLLDGRIPLQLFAVGRVVRYRASNFAAVFERYQFRTLRHGNPAS
jgi:hypothetical protein